MILRAKNQFLVVVGFILVFTGAYVTWYSAHIFNLVTSACNPQLPPSQYIPTNGIPTEPTDPTAPTVPTEPPEYPNRWLSCSQIAEMMGCDASDTGIFNTLEPLMKDRAFEDMHFKFVYNTEESKDVDPICATNDLYQLQCVQTLYHLHKAGLVSCIKTPNLEDLPLYEATLFTLPEPTVDFPRAPPISDYKPDTKIRIAYSMLLHGYADHFARLMRLLYHPDNIVVVHIDSDTEESDYNQIIATCKQYNVIVAPPRLRVKWGSLNIMYGELINLNILRDYQYDFLFFISGVDLPLKSNSELVSFLRPHIGHSFIDSKHMGYKHPETEWIYFDCALVATPVHLINASAKYKEILPPESDIDWFFGNRQMILSYNASQYLLYHPRARFIINRSRFIYIPDEKTFHTTIITSPEFKDLIIPKSHLFNDYKLPNNSYFQTNPDNYLFARKWGENSDTHDFVSWYLSNKEVFYPPANPISD